MDVLLFRTEFEQLAFWTGTGEARVLWKMWLLVDIKQRSNCELRLTKCSNGNFVPSSAICTLPTAIVIRNNLRLRSTRAMIVHTSVRRCSTTQTYTDFTVFSQTWDECAANHQRQINQFGYRAGGLIDSHLLRRCVCIIYGGPQKPFITHLSIAHADCGMVILLEEEERFNGHKSQF